MVDQERILGIDFGEKRIGLAISDPLHIIAQGLPTLVYDEIADLKNKINEIIKEYNVVKVIIGIPLNLKGEIGVAAKRCQEFIETLKSGIKIPVEEVDERFTSIIAERTLKDMGKSPSRNKAKIDELSASILLQGYLDKIKTKSWIKN